MPQSSRKIPHPQRTLLIVCIGLLLFAGLCLALLFFSSNKREPAVITENFQPTEQQVAGPQQDSVSQPENPSGAGQLSETSEGENPESYNTQCNALSQDLSAFFTYLDEQPYIQEYQFKNGILPHFREILAKLLKTPPVTSVTDNDLLDQLKNVSHFYRVLGAKDILLAKNYLTNEKGRLEHDLDVFYQWLLLDSCQQQHDVELSLPLPSLYEYAAYFLTTAGGKSYLFRRTEHTSLIVEYYCILVVDLANQAGLNRYEIDLAPFIDNSLNHMQNNNSLQNRSEYIQTLQKLRMKYAEISRKN